jgi:hypothetical protein
MTRRRRTAAIVAGIVLIAGALVGLYRAAASAPEPVKVEEFGRNVRHVASLAREAALLADLVHGNRVTGNFARTHRQKLEREVDDEVEKLKAPVPQQLDEAGERARALTSTLAETLRNLESHLPEAAFLDKTRGDAARLADEVAKLEPPK